LIGEAQNRTQFEVSHGRKGPLGGAAHYDSVPYEGKAFSQTSISRLAGIAQSAGLTPPPAKTAQVLEIGCGDGGNMLAMATAFPDAHFVGIDASFGQIARAQEVMIGGRVNNAELHCRGVEIPGDDLGCFDYIIAHGVFSWISASERTKLFEMIKSCLAPGGIAYVSYNCYPGWHTIDGLRNLLINHSAGAKTDESRIRSVRNLMRMLEEGIEAGALPKLAHYLPALKSARNDPDWYLFHDLISKYNQPCYFSHFMERAEHHGLRFVAESDPFQMASGQLPAAIRDQLPAGIDPITLGQSIDHFTNAKFRRTILTHSDNTSNRLSAAQRVQGLHIRSKLVRTETKTATRELINAEKVLFKGPFSFSAQGAVEIAALSIASNHRRLPISLNELQIQTASLLNEFAAGVHDPANVSADVSKLVAKLVSLGGFIPHSEGVVASSKLGTTPRVSPLALYMTRNNFPWVSSAAHHSVGVDKTSRFILSRLDGTQSLDQITDELAQNISDGKMHTVITGRTPLDRARNTVRQVLAHAVQSGLLVD
jgi:methyltransferase-like protein/2-polyprenyl-3-methyl-5-hydroxy-6-metoxy-1,4-benzoquinol methylase